MSKTYYIAGPMSGVPLMNFPMFDEARDAVISMMCDAISPADIDRANGITDDMLPTTPEEEEIFMRDFDTRIVARRDVLAIIDQCDGIVMLPNWSQSKGARAEHALAVWLQLDIVYYYQGQFLKENPEISIWKQNPDKLQENV